MKKINKIQVLILALTLLATSAFAVRLPTINGDSAGWGTVLNSFLQVAHESGGDIKESYISSGLIADETIVAIDIFFDVVNTTHIAEGTIINADIASNAINGSQVAQTTGLNISSLVVNTNNTLGRGNAAANISGIFLNGTNIDLPSLGGGQCFVVPINMTGIPPGINCFAMGDERSHSPGGIRMTVIGLNSTYNNCRIRVCGTDGAIDPPPLRFTALGIATGSN